MRRQVNYRRKRARIHPWRAPYTASRRTGIPVDASYDYSGPVKRWAEVEKAIQHFGASLKAAYEDESHREWREYAKQLQARLSSQRKEINRLHIKSRELRADLHENEEQLDEILAICQRQIEPKPGEPPFLPEPVVPARQIAAIASRHHKTR